MIRTHWHRLIDFWFAPVAPERLLLFQRAVALCFLYFTAGWGLYAGEWLTEAGFHLSAAATKASYPAPYPLVPAPLLVPFLVLLYGSTILLALDVGGRWMKFTVLVMAVYIQYVDQPSSFTLNKMFILSFAMLWLASPPQRIAATAPSGLPGALRLQSAWPIRTLQAILIIMYCTSGICKSVHGAWLEDADILYGQVVGVYRTAYATYAIQHMPHWFWIVSSSFALIFELGAPLWFMVRRLRPVGLLAGLLMHMGIALFLKDLIYFSLQMLTLYLLFLPDRWTVAWETQISSGLQSLRQKLSRRR